MSTVLIIEREPKRRGVRISYAEPRDTLPVPERDRPRTNFGRYRGQSWYDGRHGKPHPTHGGTTMPPTISIQDAPTRANSLEHNLPPLDAIVSALEQVKGTSKVVVVTDPCDKLSTARNTAKHAADKLAEEPHKIKARVHALTQKDGDKTTYLGALSNKPEPKSKPATPAKK